MNAIILAAGFGTRLKPYTDSAAKPAIPFLNVPLIGFSFYYADHLNCQQTVVNLHHLPESIMDACSELNRHLNTEVGYSMETPVILDSAGGIKQAYSQFTLPQGDTLVLNGDNVILLDNPDVLKEMAQFHSQNQSDITLLTTENPDAGRAFRAIWVNENDGIEDISISDRTDFHPLQFVGIMIVSEKLIRDIGDGPLHIFDDLLIPNFSKYKAFSFKVDKPLFFETGNKADFIKAQKECLNLAQKGHSTLSKIVDKFQIELDQVQPDRIL